MRTSCGHCGFISKHRTSAQYYLYNCQVLSVLPQVLFLSSAMLALHTYTDMTYVNRHPNFEQKNIFIVF